VATATEKILSVRVSPAFKAILECGLGVEERSTDPYLTALSITSDGFLMGWRDTSPFKEEFLGSTDDLDANLQGLCACAELTPEDTKAVITAFYSRVADWRTFGRKGASPYSKSLQEGA